MNLKPEDKSDIKYETEFEHLRDLYSNFTNQELLWFLNQRNIKLKNFSKVLGISIGTFRQVRKTYKDNLPLYIIFKVKELCLTDATFLFFRQRFKELNRK